MKSNKKQVIRLTESDLHRIVENSVKKMLKEDEEMDDYLNGYHTINDLQNPQNVKDAMKNRVLSFLERLESEINDFKESII